jgi:His-Xaa-Ser repeat protein HxsA
MVPPPASAAGPALSHGEKLKLQIMRVQIQLATLGLYGGAVDGVLNEETQIALRRFQVVKGLPENGLMTTPTLNALGVPAVN